MRQRFSKPRTRASAPSRKAATTRANPVRVLGVVAFIGCWILLSIPGSGAAAQGPLSPEESLKSFQTEPGLKVELVAAEPVTGDPVALAFDEAGRLFVVENRGYPTGPGPGKPGEGVVAELVDSDRDGRYDKRIVFADGLTFPNGLLPWRGGWIITCAPDILYLKDTNGDGRADLQKVLLTGFAVSGSTQLRVSHPTLSVDNWVYLTSGLTGGKVSSPEAPNRPPVEIKTDSRFNPDTGQFEAAEGRSQFGLTFDDFGRRLICMNRVHAQHVVMPGRYLRRNPALTVGEPVQNMPESLEPEPVRGHGQAARVFPISRNVTTADSHAGTFTSACGVMLYRGTGLPEEYQNNIFSCEPSGNLLHRDALVAQGASFLARRVRQGTEFLASTDNWFRPVFLTTGPDGALYLCAMYRQIIDHPDYFPGELRKRLDFTAGKGMGRIYRVSGQGPTPKTIPRALNTTNLAALCRALESPNGWHRDTAHRLLLERKEKKAEPDLTHIFENSTKPEARVHALRLLADWEALSPRLLKRALQDPSAEVRENAIQLAEAGWKNAPWFGQELLKLSQDPSARVRLQAALSLGEWPAPEAITALAQIAVLDSEDRWTRLAVLSGIYRRKENFLTEVVSQTPATPSSGFAQLMAELGRILGQTLPADKLPALLTIAFARSTNAHPGWPIAYANGIFEGAQAQGGGKVEQLRTRLPVDLENLLGKSIRNILSRSDGPVQDRVDAAAFIGHAQRAADLPLLENLLLRDKSQELLLAAVRSLGQFEMPAAARALFAEKHWGGFTPALREAALHSVLANAALLPVLLEHLEKNLLPISALTPAQRKQLLAHKNPSFKQRAAALFKNLESGDRMKVYADWKNVLPLKGNSHNGRAVFKQHCASCHRLDQEGVPVGPDLFGIRNQAKDVILLHIIVPEYEIVPGFANFEVEFKDGNSDSGMIASESSDALVLRKALGEERIVPRANIASLNAAGLSLMPQGLESNMSRQQMADLLAYLKGE